MSQVKIIRPVAKWRIFAGMAVALGVLYLAMLAFSYLVTPDTAPRERHWTAEEMGKAKQDRSMPESLEGVETRVTQDIAEGEYAKAAAFYGKYPVAVKSDIEQAIKAGELPAWYPRGESPILNGIELPDVAHRVGPEPVVMRGCEGVGNYGGVWVQFVAGSGADKNQVMFRLGGNSLFRFSPMGYPIVPHIAKGYEMKDEGRVWEIELRKIRWSDGYPFTADDVMYHWYDEMLCKSLGSGRIQKCFTAGGKPGKLEKLGPHKIRYSFPEPRTDFLEALVIYGGFRPSHYLRKYHPDYGDPEFIAAEMKKYNMQTPKSLYSFMKVDNPELPSLDPWIYRKYNTMSPFSYVRNPYYFAVDEQGNQLPYIDRLQLEAVDSMMLPLSVSSGRADMQFRYIRFDNYTEFMERGFDHNYSVRCWIPGSRSDWLISPNINRAVSERDSGSAMKAELLADKDFRKALSHSLRRQDLINAFYSGQAKPEQVDPGPYSKFPDEKLRHAYTEYDPKLANSMLDAVWRAHGLDPAVRKNGYRCGRDGEPLTFYMIFTDFTGNGPAQFVVDDWGEIGIRCIYQFCSRPLLYVRKSSRDFDFFVWSSESEILPQLSPRCFVAVNNESAYAVGWGNWFNLGGMYGDPRSNNPGTIPVPKDHPMYRSMTNYDELLRTLDPARQKALMQEITDITRENLWTINPASAAPKLVVVSDNMKNVPEKAVEGIMVMSPGNTAPETYYFVRPSSVADRDTIQQLTLQDKLPPAAGVAVPGSQRIFQVLIAGIGLLLLTLLILKHPFILRRLMIMVPTLLVISICIFTIIQLPPGDFLSTRIMQLEESGSTPEQIESEMENLKLLFHFDDPVWKRYSRWMGFTWFTSFDAKDAGLLQGNMGYSMETLKSVNSMVGDRIMLTVLISLGTVILTWSLALPIGIYSACKQYSPGDYVISVLGFLGMCIPSFLLALVLMALTGMSGLFSAEYAIQPEWSWGKVADMMKHIWLPVLVTGIGGTAGMIRVMRANLLDELNKPYVTTARAKGVRPLKLLFKYPVRLALNPFISGIGGLFPSLVSGSSIVAIVMSLPTVGPLMLGALFSQDMNMAGSMLMVLSLLGVFGTLISDLLLMMVDPRIRLEGGSK